MFYSQFILAKKGPLGTIWIAAHLERKLRKNQVADTDIGVSVDSILFPEVPIALRLSSHLLLGVVRIYSRKVNYLFDDCSEALLKIKQAFRSTAVDLPPEESTAPYHSITLPETFDLDDFELPDNEIFQGNYVDHHVSSREQITLQDTMDGVVYSTSQFGLDERFGDGDTSQIGLDLDEDLILDKVEASRYDGVSMVGASGSDETMILLKHEESNLEATPVDGNEDEIEAIAANSEFLEYAQAPATPGLVEVPNLSSVQEALACDDHMESEDHNLTQSATAECGEKASGKSELQPVDKNASDWSSHNDLNNDSTVSMPSENGCHFGDMEKVQRKPWGNAESKAVSVEFTLADESRRVEETCNGGIHTVDRTDGECVESPSCSNVTFDTEDPARRTCSSSTCIPVSEGFLENDQASLNPESHNDAETPNNVNESCPSVKAMASNASCQLESPFRPTVLDDEELRDLKTPNKPVLHEEVSSVHKHDGSSFGGDNSTVLPNRQSEAAEQCSVDISGREGEEGCQNQMSEAVHEEIETEGRTSDKPLDNVISNDNQLENFNNCETSDLPAPEKLLSVPQGLPDKTNDLLAGSTPEKEVPAGDDGISVVTKHVSGKKRSFTESTLTMESINSVESFGLPQSKRTAESVPDDDDLLSSILVGRRSSVLKMKPTPASEVASAKRARYALRHSASKRKVLMDDSMVLHGDTIRQQLTNTEDIRRVRKKAPCTRPEIAMIQRQFLEDEIFRETILAGMSAELAGLHSETYDLSGIRISEIDENHVSSEVANVECYIRPNIAKDSGIEGSSIPASHLNEIQAQSIWTAVQDENQQANGNEIDAQQHTNGVTDASQSLQHEPLKETTEMEGDTGNAEGNDTANHSVPNGYEVSSPANPIAGDIASMAPAERTDGAHPIEEDASIADMDNDKGNDPIEVLQNIVVETEIKEIDELMVDESKANTSVENSRDIQLDCSVATENGFNSLATENVETERFLDADPTEDVFGNNKLGVLNEDLDQGADLEIDDKDPVSMGIEEPKMDSMYSIELDAGVIKASVNDGENPASQEFDALDAEVIARDHAFVANYDEFGNIGVANDTEFLNVDDDELGEEDEDGMPCTEDSRLLENSGWSSRTRAVGKYLQNLFDNETVHARRILSLDSLLAGKTRKEASRMFFETLVLKTKDFIQVEQAKPLDNISIKPRAKLMKSDF